MAERKVENKYPERCPFCGYGAEVSHTSGGNGDGFSVMCNSYKCGAMGPQKRTRAAAKSAWNRIALAAGKKRKNDGR